MIMLSELTLNNYTAHSEPVWKTGDNYARLLAEKVIADREQNLLQRTLAKLSHGK